MLRAALILLSIIAVIAGIAAITALPWIGSWVVTLSGWDWWGATLAVIYVLFVVLAVAGRAIMKLWGDSREHRRKLKEWVDEPVEIVGVSMMLLGFTVAVFGVWYLHLQGGGAPKGIFADLVSDFYANLSVDFISVGIAILIINRLYEQRSKLEEKQRIIKQLRSPSAEFAKEAARIVTEKGWSRDGSLKGVDLVGAKLTDAYLAGADLTDAKLWGADLADAYLADADLGGAYLMGADLTGAKLMGADLGGAYLMGADLADAYLWGVDLTGADLGGAKLAGATFDAFTIWPEGFDPVAAGAMFLILKE